MLDRSEERKEERGQNARTQFLVLEANMQISLCYVDGRSKKYQIAAANEDPAQHIHFTPS